MMTEIVPIGTVVQYISSRAMVVGYTYLENGTEMKLMYVMVPWPTGFAKPDDCRVVSPENVSVIAMGEMTQEAVLILQYHNRIQNIIRDKPAAQVRQAWKELYRELFADGGKSNA